MFNSNNNLPNNHHNSSSSSHSNNNNNISSKKCFRNLLIYHNKMKSKNLKLAKKLIYSKTFNNLKNSLFKLNKHNNNKLNNAKI